MRYQPITWHQGQTYNPTAAFNGAIQGADAFVDQMNKRNDIEDERRLNEALSRGFDTGDFTSDDRRVDAAALMKGGIDSRKATSDLLTAGLTQTKTQAEIDEMPDRLDIFKRSGEADIDYRTSGAESNRAATRINNLNADTAEEDREKVKVSEANVAKLDELTEGIRSEEIQKNLNTLVNEKWPNGSSKYDPQDPDDLARMNVEAKKLTENFMNTAMYADTYRSTAEQMGIPLADFDKSIIGQLKIKDRDEAFRRAGVKSDLDMKRNQREWDVNQQAAVGNYQGFIADPITGELVIGNEQQQKNENVAKGELSSFVRGIGSNTLTKSKGFGSKAMKTDKMKAALDYMYSHFNTRSVIEAIIKDSIVKGSLDAKSIYDATNERASALKQRSQVTNEQVYNNMTIAP